jgi:hypothetical protein
MVKHECYFCHEKRATKQIELDDDMWVWFCGECWDDIIGSVLASLPDTPLKTKPNLDPTKTERTS